jgi:hypothetical protein
MWKHDPIVSHLPKVTDLKAPPEIGTWYAVPTFPTFVSLGLTRNRRHRAGAIKVHHLPVFLPPHEDKHLFNFPAWHYHIDLRFINDNELRRLLRKHAALRTKKITKEEYQELCNHIPFILSGEASYGEKIVMVQANSRPHLERVKWKAAICVRDYQRPEKFNLHSIIAREARFQKTRPYCGRCPHKGINLDQIPTEHRMDGSEIKVCPAHGGKWQIKDGQISVATYDPIGRFGTTEF